MTYIETSFENRPILYTILRFIQQILESIFASVGWRDNLIGHSFWTNFLCYWKYFISRRRKVTSILYRLVGFLIDSFYKNKIVQKLIESWNYIFAMIQQLSRIIVLIFWRNLLYWLFPYALREATAGFI